MEAVGKAVRSWLAGIVRDRCDGKKWERVGTVVADAVEGYDSAEAKEWAKAGRLRYVAHMFREELLQEHWQQDSPPFFLPHHSLLAKDKPSSRPVDGFRFELGCLLATRITADLVRWYFGANPSGSINKPAEVLTLHLAHPAVSVEPGPDFESLTSMARSLWKDRWETLSAAAH